MTDHAPREPRPSSQARPTPLGRASEDLYETLRDMAQARIERRADAAALEPAELVHECYLRLAETVGFDFVDRPSFLALVSRVLRQLLADAARSRGRLKRGAGWKRIELDGEIVCEPARPEHLVALDEALERLARRNRRQARVVELRFLAGLSIAETADLLGCAVSQVESDWLAARAWLKRELAE
jgi:RNA polymerase sigma factor (TIGR02999 family)